MAFAAGPLIERGEGENWLLVKPPTSVVVAVDPDPPFDTDDNIKAQQAKMIDEIVAVIRAQGIEPDRSDLEDLVRIESWTQSCFEFSHFDDEEIATAIASVHPDCNGLSHERLVAALRRVRDHRCDIKTVWSNWRSKPSKTALARALWPYLQEKIMRAEAYPDVPVPEVVVRLEEAHRQATARPAGRWILKGVAIRR